MSETQYSDDPICPYCGYKQRDAWEIKFGPGSEGETEVDCGECGKTFICSRSVTVTYCTNPKDPA